MKQGINDNNKKKHTEDELALRAFIKTLWNGRKTVLKNVLIFMGIGLFFAVFSKKVYTASTTMVPATQGKNIGGNLSGLAAIAGINLGGSTSESGISPTLYPQIIGSIPFQKEMLKTPITIVGHKSPISYEDYYTNYYNIGVLGYLKKYTIGLPGVISNAINGKPNVVTTASTALTNIASISTEEQKLVNQLSEQLSLKVNIKDGYVSIEVDMPEAIAAAEMTQKAQQLLQKYIINFKVQKSSEQLKFIKDRFSEKETEFKNAQKELASFQDKNQFMNSALAKMTLLRLQGDYDLSYEVYSELAKKMETQQIQVKEDTPVFTVLEPVVVPYRKSEPQRGVIIITWMFIGGLIGAGIVFLGPFFVQMKKRMRSVEYND